MRKSKKVKIKPGCHLFKIIQSFQLIDLMVSTFCDFDDAFNGIFLDSTPGLKTNNMVNLNNSSTTSPILDFKKSLDRAHQDLKLCIRKQPPRGDSF